MEKQNLSASAVAAKLGKPRSWISKILSGQFHIKLSDFFGLSEELGIEWTALSLKVKRES